MKNSYIEAYFATISAGLYPFTADMARNFQLFTPRQIGLTTLAIWIGITALFAMTYLGLLLVDNLARRWGRVLTDRMKESVFAALIAGVFFIFYFNINVSTLRDGYGLSKPVTVLGLSILLAAYVMLVFLLKPKWIAVGFVVGIMVLTVQTGTTVRGMEGGKNPNVTSADKAVFEQVRLTRTPNIYWLYAESYHGEQAMKDLYGFDNGLFLDFLRSNGFEVSRGIYANYDHTLTSLHSFLLMGHHYSQADFGNEDSLDARGFITGTGASYNPVLRILKNNGYSVVYLLPSDYYYRPGEGLVDRSLLSRSWSLAPLKVSLPYFIKRGSEAHVEDYERKVREFISSRVSRAPSFFFIQTGMAHAPKKYRYQTGRRVWVARYLEMLGDANREIQELCSLIIAKDPTAVIILAGDHGARSYKDNVRTIPALVSEDGLPLRLIGQDYFDVVLAIRMGEGLKPAAYPFHSMANVMRFVLYRLSDDENLLKTAQADVSFYKDKKSKVLYEVVLDGTPRDTLRAFVRK